MSIKWFTDVWISELEIFKWSKSLISSQHLPEVRSSVIKVQVKPFDLACASLVLLSPVLQLQFQYPLTSPLTVLNGYHLRWLYPE